LLLFAILAPAMGFADDRRARLMTPTSVGL
jgi:hypothetical protein